MMNRLTSGTNPPDSPTTGTTPGPIQKSKQLIPESVAFWFPASTGTRQACSREIFAAGSISLDSERANRIPGLEWRSHHTCYATV